MRIHGVHFQGIRAPQGEHRIAFDPGYNVAIAGAPDEARALLHLLEALLYPSPDRIRFARAGEQLPRAGLSFSFGSDAYRVILDFEKGRLLLGRYESGADTWQRMTTDAAETSRALAALGLPSREDFERLHLLAAGVHEGQPAREGTPEDTARAAAQPAREPKPEPAKKQPAPRWRDQELERAKLQARLRILRSARERYLTLEREEKVLASELEGRSVLADGLDELDVRLERFRTQNDTRGEELSTVEGARRALLNERARLAGVPQAQMPGMWLGVALGAAAALAGSVVAPVFYVLGVVGAATALFGLLIARSARRRMGRVEARLAALRVREASIERRFESETSSVRTLVRALELDSIDEIQREATDYRRLLGRAEAIRRDLDEARVAFPAEAEDEIQQLERRMDDPNPEVARVEEVAPVSAAEPAVEAPLEADAGGASEKTPKLVGEEPFLGEPSTDPRTPFLAEAARISLEPLLRAAQKSSSRPESEIREALRPVLPIYLRAITGGLYTRAWYHPGDGWHFRREGEAERVPFRDAPPGDRARVATAFRLALLETLAPGLRVPLVVGPGLDALDQDERTTLARAIARVGAAVQVIQCTADEHWAAGAGSVYRLST